MSDGEQRSFAKRYLEATKIAMLNDALRKTGLGGQLVFTSGVSALPDFDSRKLLVVLAAFNGFDEGNDPYGERDFGDVELCGQTLLWKIDYYDKELEQASTDPADPLITTRVLTVMLEQEY